IPVVDFSKEDCLKPGTSSWLSASKGVCQALEQLGCFIVTLSSNKVSLELHNTIFRTLNELFDLPMEIKVPNTNKNDGGGGYSTLHPAHESFGIVNSTNPEETQKFTNRFWTNGNDQFRESVDSYAKVMAELDRAVTRMVFENYGVDKYHDDHVQSTFHGLRFSKYKEPKKTGIDVGLGSHTDKTFTTILHQNNVNGLEINTKNDEWICCGYPLPSSFLFLAGDVFQVWSNDRIRPCRHRVSLTENNVRYSFGLYSIKEGVTNIPDELVDEDHPLRFKPLNHIEYARARYDNNGTDLGVKSYCGI
ncbi:deoxypodophyllotoxin synthase-like, partial [Rosa rugosa]|uniref:deoxypodophyllotoxin synthase-like n=1 Tax=Rosa rugosa TaxID=74645 RepID=UPI002B402B81